MSEYKGLAQTQAANTLRVLAQHPYDLTAPNGLNRDRIASYIIDMAEYRLLYGAQRIDESVIDALQQLADESQAVPQYMGMKHGEVINRIDGFDSENRMVLHTAVRDVFSVHPCHGEASSQACAELAKLKDFLAEIDSGKLVNHKSEKFTDMLMVGIGGSDLGPRALYLALKAFAVEGRRVHFISNVDPDDAAAVLKEMNLETTLVNVVSKSGTTLETLTNEELVRSCFAKADLDPNKHFVAVTGKGSPMDNPDRYLRSFYMFDYIGGRYSATSMVGAVMLGFALGYDQFVEILQGAHQVDVDAEQTDIRKNIPLMLALLGIWNRNFLGHETVTILPYSQALIRFTAHLQQCDMESNGKSVDRQGRGLEYQSGPIVWGEPGTNGQHAFYQLIHQGTTIVPVEFIGYRQSQYKQDITIEQTSSQQKLVANLLAQSMALAGGQASENPNKKFAGNRPNSVLIADRLTPYSMGALLAIYEAKIAFQGFVWNINSFDQEGVQLGKVLANQILDQMKRPEAEVLDGAALAALEAAKVLDS